MSSVPVQHVPVIQSPAWVSAVCIGCSQALLIPAGSTPPLCGGCERSAADAEARKLFSDVRDLVQGRGVFKVLPAVDRAGLLLAAGFTPATVAPFMSDRDLISVCESQKSSEAAIDAASAELVRRMHLEEESPASLSPLLSYRGNPSDAPDPQTRAALEAEDEQEHREATIDLETSQLVGERWDGLA